METETLMQFSKLVSGLLNPFSHLEFEVIFGTVMSLLIATEFNHRVVETMNRFHRLIQVKTVVLIGILARVRKFITVNIETTSATTIAALTFALIALGGLYCQWARRIREVARFGRNQTKGYRLRVVRECPPNP
jgi:uncharacterized membrane protein (DUF373 family)